MRAAIYLPRHDNRKGIDFARVAIAKAVGHLDGARPIDIAIKAWGSDSPAARLLKAATSASRYSDIGGPERAIAALFDAVAERSVLGRLPGLRRVPLRTRTLFPSAPITASWVPEGAAVPVGATAWTGDTLEPRRVAAMAVATEETLRAAAGGDPSAEQGIRNDLVTAIAHGADLALLDPTNAGDDATPAAVTNGATAISAGGDPVADIRELVEAFAGDLTTSALVMRPEVAASIAGPAFPRVGVNGGEVLGLPVLTSRKAPAASIILIDGASIATGNGTDAGLSISTKAAIQMDDDPDMTGDSPTGTSVVSLWQTNSVGLLADITTGWKRVRADAVVMITGATYAPVVT